MIRSFIRTHCTVGNVAATAALVIAMSGTSYAAVTITGARVRDNSILSTKVARASLTAAKIDAKFRASLAGPTGPAGRAGASGNIGARGPTGDPGETGAPAVVVASSSSWDPGYVDTTNPGLNVGRDDWYEYEYGESCTAPNCHLNAGQAAAATSLNGGAAGTTILDLTQAALPASGAQSYGELRLPFDGATVTAWANVSLLYRTDDDLGAELHTRAECWMEIGGVAAGPKTLVSSGDQHDIQTIYVVGNARRDRGNYNAEVKCRDADATPSRTRWKAVRANLVATGSPAG